MVSLNRVTAIGNLGRDVEVKTMSNGNPVANMSVACTESWKDKQTGEWQDKTEWLRVVVFNEHMIRRAEKLSKGDRVYVEGSLQTRSYEKDGSTRYQTEVVLQRFKGELFGIGNDTNSSSSTENNTAGNGFGDGSTGFDTGDLDDEIPFITKYTID